MVNVGGMAFHRLVRVAALAEICSHPVRWVALRVGCNQTQCCPSALREQSSEYFRRLAHRRLSDADLTLRTRHWLEKLEVFRQRGCCVATTTLRRDVRAVVLSGADRSYQRPVQRSTDHRRYQWSSGHSESSYCWPSTMIPNWIRCWSRMCFPTRTTWVAPPTFWLTWAHLGAAAAESVCPRAKAVDSLCTDSKTHKHCSNLSRVFDMRPWSVLSPARTCRPAECIAAPSSTAPSPGSATVDPCPTPAGPARSSQRDRPTSVGAALSVCATHRTATSSWPSRRIWRPCKSYH